MRETESQAWEAYRQAFGTAPEALASAPGRINLIGEHTDYNDGFVLPCAIDRRIAVAVGHGDGGLFSTDFDGLRKLDEEDDSWAKYPRGVVWAMREAGYDPGVFQAAFAGDVPRASGLSSSAAIEAATALALDALHDFGIQKKDLAVLCQRAENGYVGVRSGIMDQYASILCERGAALLVDCRSLEAISVPLDLDAADLVLLVCDTRVERGLADTGYNDRRASCERAAEILGVEALRDASEGDLAQLFGIELKRARHIVTENGRVLEAVDALRDADYATFGRLMYHSHDSMRDDFEISTPELDAFVELAAKTGAPGARLTGAGFGGCAISLVESAYVETLSAKVRAGFEERNFETPRFYRFLPANGAEAVYP